MPRFIDISGSAPIAAASEARAAINAPGNGGVTIDFTDYGACDGATDDRVAFVTALAALATAGGGTLQLPPTDIAITLTGGPTLTVPPNVRMVGTPGATRILMSSTSVDEYFSFAGNSGDEVSFEGITFLRNTDCTGYVFYLLGGSGFHVRNCVIDGQRDIYSRVWHGFFLGSAGDKENITIRDSTVTRVNYGLFQPDAEYGDVDRIYVDNCRFHQNYRDDLEFNSPMSAMTNVFVSNCTFTENQYLVEDSDPLLAGLGIGFAGVSGAVVTNCVFDGTFSDAIHLEWDANNILIANNRFVGCCKNVGTNITHLDRASINIMAYCYDVVVTGNIIDHRPNTNTNGLHAITVRNYTGGTSLVGKPCLPPWRITVTDNTIYCGENFSGIWACDIDGITVKGNRIIGDGTVTAGTWDDGNIRAGMMIDGQNTVIADNAVSGFRYGISGPLAEDQNGAALVSLPFDERLALGDPGIVSGNLVTDCYIGFVAASSGRLNVSGNTASNCVRPMIVGEGLPDALPSVVTGNFATGCTYPIEADGKLVLIRKSGGSTLSVSGSLQTMMVDDIMSRLPRGTAIKFSGGGTFVIDNYSLLSLYPPDGTGYEIRGTVSVADIGASDYGIVEGIHSSTAANNMLTFIGNTDTTSGVYPKGSDPDALTVGESVFPRGQMSSTTLTATNGLTRLSFFTATKTEDISQVRSVSGGTAQVGATLCRLVVYSISKAGVFTQVATTANDTSLWTVANTAYTTSFSAPFAKIAGTRYAVGMLVVGSSTAPTMQGRAVASGGATNEAGVDPIIAGYISSATDLVSNPASATAASPNVYFALLP